MQPHAPLSQLVVAFFGRDTEHGPPVGQVFAGGQHVGFVMRPTHRGAKVSLYVGCHALTPLQGVAYKVQKSKSMQRFLRPIRAAVDSSGDFAHPKGESRRLGVNHAGSHGVPGLEDFAIERSQTPCELVGEPALQLLSCSFNALPALCFALRG